MLEKFNLIKNKSYAHSLAILLIVVALILQTIEFVANAAGGKFLFETLFAYIFDFTTNILLAYALLRNKVVLIEIALVVLKVFDGTYYPLKSCQRLDALMIVEEIPTFYLVSHILFAVAAFSLLLALICYCTYKVRDNVRFWSIMKIFVLVATVFMAAVAVLYCIESARNSEVPWSEVLEPVSCTVLFFAMFVTYEYVEELTIYAE